MEKDPSAQPQPPAATTTATATPRMQSSPEPDLPSKDYLERKKLHQELRFRWRFAQAIGLLAPGLAFVLGIISVMHIYQQNQVENFRSLLKDIGAEKAHTRLSAVSRLFTYDEKTSPVAVGANWLFGGMSTSERQAQIVNAVTAALRLEDDMSVKKEMLRLLITLGDKALPPLKQVRIDLITQLKIEGPEKKPSYWGNLRETLFHVAIAIARVSRMPPDFRCFPLKDIRVRQQVLDDKANFEGATLASAELWGGKMREAVFRDANLFQAVVRDIDLENASFEGAELRKASFGPNIRGLSTNAFENSNWATVAKFDPPQFRKHLQQKFGTSGGKVRQGKDRDALCSHILNTDFQVTR